ncbi:MAG: hypothetical protein M3P16_06250 [Chloroflexota bacterium]|nr:hypothetical protein [Chloroflexota bacterium]
MLIEVGHEVEVRSELPDGMIDADAELVITDLLALRSYDLETAREWIARVRAAFPRATFIVSTAHAPAAGDARALAADAVLAKPFDVTVFTRTVAALLGA